MAEPVRVPTRRYVDVALGLLGADEAAELILQTVSMVFFSHRRPLYRLLFYFYANTNFDTHTYINY